MLNNALFSSNSDNWATPDSVFNDLDKEFRFNLDVCASADNYKCKEFFTESIDGLAQSWGGVESFVTRLIVK